MREIKFRAWCPIDRKMFDWNDVGIESYNPYLLIERSKGDKLGHRNWDSDLILLQYTGLKDKSGEEIYEADIIEGYPVEYHAPFFAIKRETKEGISWTGLQYNHELLVIGNIYQNPELLK